MLVYPEIDPIAVSLGPVRIHWYGLMYVLGFLGGWWVARRRAAMPGSTWKAVDVDDLIFFSAIGVILGGRLGWILFYGFDSLLADPWSIFRVWQGGMSFHGGLLGVLVAAWLFGRKHGLGFFGVTDFIAPLVPLGLGAGRVGNFINGELWGRVSDVPWAMVFAHAGPLPRHPSQLYEAGLEGLLLGAALWILALRGGWLKRPGAITGGFFLGYGLARSLVENFRQMDAQIGYVIDLGGGGLTMGQLLSLPMVLIGLGFLWNAWRRAGERRA